MYTPPSRRVRLTCDLTRYDHRLVEGSLGWTGREGQWGNIVQYDCGAVIDTLWRSLEFLKEETQDEARRLKRCDFECDVKDLIRLGADPAAMRRDITKWNREVQKETRREARRNSKRK